MIPVYMSHRIYNKKRDGPGASENVLKFWVLASLLYSVDLADTLIQANIDANLYFLFLLGKACTYIFLFVNNFYYSGRIYDIIVPTFLPIIQPLIDTMIEKARAGRSYFISHITPTLAQTFVGNAKDFAVYIALKGLRMLEFKAAPNEPERVPVQPPKNRNAVSFMEEPERELMQEKKAIEKDLNVTSIPKVLKDENGVDTEIRRDKTISLKEGTVI